MGFQSRAAVSVTSGLAGHSCHAVKNSLLVTRRRCYVRWIVTPHVLTCCERQKEGECQIWTDFSHEFTLGSELQHNRHQYNQKPEHRFHWGEETPLNLATNI